MRTPCFKSVKCWLCIWLVLHFSMMALGVFHQEKRLDHLPVLHKIVGVYNEFAMVVWRFGFFAPEVGPEVQPGFTLRDEDGRSWEGRLHCANNEIWQKVCCMNAFVLIDSIPYNDLFSRSWAIYLLNHDSAAVAADVAVTRVDLVPLDSAALLAPSLWRKDTIYFTTYEINE